MSEEDRGMQNRKKIQMFINKINFKKKTYITRTDPNFKRFIIHLLDFTVISTDLRHLHRYVLDFFFPGLFREFM